MPCRGIWGSTRVGQEAEGKGKSIGTTLLGFLPERQDRLNTLGLASLNNSNKFWGLGVVPRCLALG